MRARFLKSDEKHLWEKFSQKHPLGTIQQSLAWGHFQQSLEQESDYWILVIEEGDKILGGGIITRQNLPKGFSWLYCTRGPLFNYDDPQIHKKVELFTQALKPIAREQKSIFLRIDPPLAKPPKLPRFKTTKHGYQPTDTLIVDLSISEKEILAQMKQKGRYNIKKAQKAEVKVTEIETKDPKKFLADLDAFYEILEETTKRDNFAPRPKHFYQRLLEALMPTNQATLYLATHQDKVIAGNIVTFFRDTATYYYGASSNEHRKVMAPYLLQWHSMQQAKSRGFTHYDFLGIAPPDAPSSHPWHGITQFKTRFGGTHTKTAPAQHFVFNPLLNAAYKLYKLLR